MSGVYRSIQQAQAAIERLSGELEMKSKIHSKLSFECTSLEEKVNKVESTLNNKRSESIQLLEKQLRRSLDIQKLKNENLDAELKVIEENVQTIRETDLQYRLLYSQKLTQINKEYLTARAKVRQDFLDEFAAKELAFKASNQL